MSVSTVWQDCNGTTKDFLSVIKQANYQNQAFAHRFKSFAWEFSCILRTRLCYIEAFKSGALNFLSRGDIKDKSVYESLSIKEMRELIHVSGVELTEILRLEHSEELALWLLRHESMHHGKLMLYFAQNHLEIPARLKQTWGESNFN